MSFIFMVLHWPEPGRRDALAQSMREMGDALRGLPGCTAVEPPYLTSDGTCLVGISRWKSRQAFIESGITLRPPDEIAEGETRPRQRLLLEEAGTSPHRSPAGEGGTAKRRTDTTGVLPGALPAASDSRECGAMVP